MLLQLFLHAIEIRAREIHLIYGHHDLHVWRGLGVINCFDRLRHNAVLSGDDQHHDVGYIRATRAHRGESGVAWCINEGDLVSIVLDTVRSDVLGDSAGFTGRDARLPNRI